MKNSPEIIDIKKTYLAISLMLLAILCVDSYMVVIKFLGDESVPFILLSDFSFSFVFFL